MQGVFNPNIPIYHPPNSAEGLHFSAFHYYCKIIFQQHNKLGCSLCNNCNDSVYAIPYSYGQTSLSEGYIGNEWGVGVPWSKWGVGVPWSKWGVGVPWNECEVGVLWSEWGVGAP